MFGIGIPELMVVLVIALIVIGPSRLPEVAKALGKGYLQLQRAFRDVRGTLNEEIDEIRKEVDVTVDDEMNKKDP